MKLLNGKQLPNFFKVTVYDLLCGVVQAFVPFTLLTFRKVTSANARASHSTGFFAMLVPRPNFGVANSSNFRRIVVLLVVVV